MGCVVVTFIGAKLLLCCGDVCVCVGARTRPGRGYARRSPEIHGPVPPPRLAGDNGVIDERSFFLFFELDTEV